MTYFMSTYLADFKIYALTASSLQLLLDVNICTVVVFIFLLNVKIFVK